MNTQLQSICAIQILFPHKITTNFQHISYIVSYMYAIVYIVLADTVAISARIQRCNGTAYDTALIISGYLAVHEPSHDNFPIHKLINDCFSLISPEHQTILYNGLINTVYRPVDLFMNFPSQ